VTNLAHLHHMIPQRDWRKRNHQLDSPNVPDGSRIDAKLQ
jgi:hypothetical protein